MTTGTTAGSAGPEKIIGVWRRSMMSPGFWARTIGTVGMYPLLLWRKNQITLTNRRVMQRVGNVLGGKEISISLENITDVTIDTSTAGALLGYSNVRIQSAGSTTAEIAFEGIADSNKLRQAIFDLQDGKADDKSTKEGHNL